MAYTIAAVKTLYKGIEMDSGLESGYAMWLDEWDFDWEYHPHAIAGDSGRWRPDFLVRGAVHIGDRRDLLVDVKHENWFATAADPDQLARRMSQALAMKILPVVESPGHNPMIAFGQGIGFVETMWALRQEASPDLVLPISNAQRAWYGEWWMGRD